MRKSDKKLDNEIRKELTAICESQLKSYEGFEWLTHTANYNNFPASLRVICVFNNNEQLKAFLTSDKKAQASSSISKALSGLGIKLPAAEKLVQFDSEENCERENRGNWQAHLA